MNRLIVGLVGEECAGKEKFWELIVKVARENDVFAINRFSTTLRLEKTLDDYDITPSRDNKKKLVKMLEEGFAEGTVAAGVYKLIRDDRSTIKVVDSVRLLPDETALRKESGNLMLYLTAKPQVRAERMKKRNRDPGDDTMTVAKLLEKEKSPTEIHIPEIGKRADFTIRNNSNSEKDLEKAVRMFFNRKIRPLLKEKG